MAKHHGQIASSLKKNPSVLNCLERSTHPPHRRRRIEGVLYPPRDYQPISSMKRKQLIEQLQEYRDVWEIFTTRNLDLSDERINSETVKELRSHLVHYTSAETNTAALQYLIPILKYSLRSVQTLPPLPRRRSRSDDFQSNLKKSGKK